MEKYNTRADVPEKYKCDLTEYYKNNEEFEKNYNEAVKLVDDLKKYSGCCNDSNKLYEFLKEDIETSAKVENLYVYSYLIFDLELGVSESISRKAKSEDLYTKYSTNTSFFEPELLKLSKEEYDKLFISNPKLNEYKSYLDKIYRDKEHILSESEEIIVNELSSAIDHFEDMSSTMLNSEHDYGTVEIDGEKEVITATNYRKLSKNKDRNIRKEVREKLSKVVNQYGTSSAQFLDSYVKSNIAICKIRKYKNCFDSKLFGLNMPNEAFETLINTVEENVDKYQKYLKLFKKVKGLDELYQYDLNLDLNNFDKEYSVEEAQNLCLKAIEPLGEDYVKHFKKIIDERHVDYAQYKGKCAGGYCISTHDKNSRILMSFNNNLDSVSTLIHEGGHNVHHQYLIENNPIQYRSASSIIAEVASLTNECLLSSYLAEYGNTDEEKLAGLSNIIGVINSNLFGAVREGHMEQDFYKYVESGGTITNDYMDNLDIESQKKYYGNEVNLDEYSSVSWKRRSHFYMFFYLYSYAFCISVASYVASEILKGNKEMLDKYIKFLSTGSDKWPTEVFEVLDIDLTSKEVYESAIKYYEDLIDKYYEIEKRCSECQKIKGITMKS